ncbi:hypothetical protein FJ705_06815 [Staphylococcus aureus]|nr:hypothetical protein FJ705_06815 [Staphylococcus aureus]
MTERKCACNKLFSILVNLAGGAPTQRISKRNSTGNASWGVGPNTEADEKSAYNNVQVGVGRR